MSDYVPLDETTCMMVAMLRAHRAAEPDREQFPADDGHAQSAYWTEYDQWQSVEYGLRMMVGARLINLLDSN